MIYVPKLRPLLESGENIYTEINYDKRLTGKDDTTRDGEHIHDFWELYINLDGDVSFLVEDTLYPIGRGDVIVTAPNEIHRCIFHSDCVHEHFCIWIREIPFASDRFGRDFAKHKLLILSDEDKERLISDCFVLFESQSGKIGSPFGGVKSFFEILDLICAQQQKAVAGQGLPTGFGEIVEYISQHYAEPSCTVTNLCDAFYISKSTLCRRFRQHFQMTPSDYIEAKRLAEAKRLLGAGQSVQSACLNSGFSDCSYFIMRFRKKFGITPYKYQKDFH